MTGDDIEDHALLSDRHGAALVTRSGTVDWLCLPRFDSPSVFGSLLDGDAGHWSLRPDAPTRSRRRYLDGTLVLRTEHTCAEGTLVVTEALATGPSLDPHRLGAEAPHVLVRAIACTEGRVRVRTSFQPRPEYGVVVPLVSSADGGVRCDGGPLTLSLSSPVPPDVTSAGATCALDLSAGEEGYFALQWSPMSRNGPGPWSQRELADLLRDTVEAWRGWSRAHEGYTGPWRDLVSLSGRVLQGLSYQPTGAIVAAPTTSLPEQRGGERNWDYRYAWVRDAALTMDALWVAACPDEADEFFSFMTRAAATGRSDAPLQIMYGVGGEHDLAERELPHLGGWYGSRPVRVGNAAWDQHQLDVYGELLSTAARFADQVRAADPPLRAFLVRLADTAARAWHSRDHGIWEVRGRPRHFLHSKLMCWVALDRALGMADHLGADQARVRAWEQERERIRTAILEQGWNAGVGAFTQSFGDPSLDAAALMLPITGFLPGDDPRVAATIDAVAEHLTGDSGLVRRYDTAGGVDGLSGQEGDFLLCTFWLAQAQALAGRTGQARATFERAAARANDLGLLAEQTEAGTGRMLGNFPQALSHIGLVSAAWTIAQREGPHGSAVRR